ncbi:uncharacterized protein LOC116655321 [Drosophila ananassae]|uniref:uncharacterized protein LOC116655321 n=1 Tax=Drosophila ananassae TaxID=7217 RepID=UPI0013A5D6A2|nr:uncharacterized protein LOC116655321 [Drosophila ananassae]
MRVYDLLSLILGAWRRTAPQPPADNVLLPWPPPTSASPQYLYLSIYVSVHCAAGVAASATATALTADCRRLLTAALCQSEQQILFFGHFAIRSPPRRPEPEDPKKINKENPAPVLP